MIYKKNNFQVILVGDTGVGKTCIIDRAVHNTFRENLVATTGSIVETYTKDIEGSLSILDTAGQERFDAMLPMYFHGKDAAILVYSIDNSNSFKSLTRWTEPLKENDIPIVFLVENKIDLRGTEEDVVNNEDGKEKAMELGFDFLSVSAKKGIGVDVLFQKVFQECLSSPSNIPKSFPIPDEPDNKKCC